jgi:hypothetical protein
MGEAQQEKPADAWGQPISEGRQAELTELREVWDAPGADRGVRKRPFDGMVLSGADVSWLADQSGREAQSLNPINLRPQKDHGRVPNLHLEGTNLASIHLEGTYLDGAHLEGAYLEGAHLETLYVNPSRGGS